MQAACGLAQLDKLEEFIIQRKKNFNFLYDGLKIHEDKIILPLQSKNSDTSWFGFPITIKDYRYKREDLINYLNKNKVATRLLFGGDITRQPYFQNIEYKVFGKLTNTEIVMNNTFWIGVQPSLTKEMLEFAAHKIKIYLGVDF